MRKLIIGISIVTFFVGVIILTAPNEEVKTPPQKISVPDDVETYIRDTESKIGGLKPAVEKKIIWYDSAKSKTEYAVVFLHGYSASRQEIAPVSEMIADSLHANVFYSRLTAHGVPGWQLDTTNAVNWLMDAMEAIEIGKKIGKKIILVSNSTGGTLSAWLATTDYSKDIEVLFMLSPNFGLKDSRSFILGYPWARKIVPLVAGDTLRWKPINELQAKYWTTSYPSTAVIQLYKLIEFSKKLPLERITIPSLFIYSSKDEVVEALETDKVFDRFGGDKKRIYFDQDKHPNNHVLVGNVFSPYNDKIVVDYFLEFFKSTKK